MSKVTVYRAAGYDILTDEPPILRRWGIREAIEAMGLKLLEILRSRLTRQFSMRAAGPR